MVYADIKNAQNEQF